jgi:peptidoglycan/xylan/chitin deacetylase (PgdA/CDA1 family)
VRGARVFSDQGSAGTPVARHDAYPGGGGKKLVLARGLGLLRMDEVLLQLQDRLFQRAYIRALLYHDVPERWGDNFDRQLEYFSRRFSPVSLHDLDRFLHGSWDRKKPGLILSFDDGFRSAHSVVAPRLRQHGFTGWFFVPTDFIDAPPSQQREYAERHRITPLGGAGDARIAMSWEEVRELSREHVVGSHTRTHHRLTEATGETQASEEVRESKRILEERLGHAVQSFSWVGGNEWAYSRGGAAVIRDAGYRFAFMTNSSPIRHATDRFHLQRTHVEANWPLEVVRLQISGVIDVLYLGKRRRVNRLTAAGM